MGLELLDAAILAFLVIAGVVGWKLVSERSAQQ